MTTARELAIDEIAALCATGVPIEVFCHGAICIGYSGACEFSALRRGRSAMRGDCTQPCRLAYDLVDEAGESVVSVEGDRLLCPRDYLGIAHLPELVGAGVASCTRYAARWHVGCRCRVGARERAGQVVQPRVYRCVSAGAIGC